MSIPYENRESCSSFPVPILYILLFSMCWDKAGPVNYKYYNTDCWGNDIEDGHNIVKDTDLECANLCYKNSSTCKYALWYPDGKRCWLKTECTALQPLAGYHILTNTGFQNEETRAENITKYIQTMVGSLVKLLKFTENVPFTYDRNDTDCWGHDIDGNIPIENAQECANLCYKEYPACTYALWDPGRGRCALKSKCPTPETLPGYHVLNIQGPQDTMSYLDTVLAVMIGAIAAEFFLFTFDLIDLCVNR